MLLLAQGNTAVISYGIYTHTIMAKYTYNEYNNKYQRSISLNDQYWTACQVRTSDRLTIDLIVKYFNLIA